MASDWRTAKLGCYHCGIEAGRYISLERIIEQNKERYYEVLEQSSFRWHEGKQIPPQSESRPTGGLTNLSQHIQI